MTDDILDQLFRRLHAEGFRQVALELVQENVDQVRFSSNTKDLHNHWNEESISVFAETNGRTVSTVIKDASALDSAVARLKEIAARTPENPSFSSLNPEPQSYSGMPRARSSDVDIEDLASAMINGSLASGSERVAGLVYNRRSAVTVMTDHNRCSYETGGIEAVIRAFRGNFTGQEAQHFGIEANVDSSTMERLGAEAAETASLAQQKADVEPGRHRVLLSPYVMGNILTYSSGFLSYYSVETGLSCFSDLLGKEVSFPGFNLHDSPLDFNGVGARLCDEEGTATARIDIISGGVLKSYLHSYSTASRAGVKTTANAGIISPRSWQLQLDAGRRGYKKILEDMGDGLLIGNSWYTRFQDYRNGVFSTVPRDGVFLVKNGEISGSVSGIRISDSVTSILSGVREISREAKNVKWWEEIAPSSMPYVLVDNVNISRAF